MSDMSEMVRGAMYTQTAHGAARPLDVTRKRRIKAELRALIDGGVVLHDIERLCMVLERGYDVLVDDKTFEIVDRIPHTSARVAAIGKVLDAKFKMLNKVLPDLKAIELTGEDGKPIEIDAKGDRSGRMVMATKLLHLLHEARTDGTLSAPPIEGTATHEHL